MCFCQTRRRPRLRLAAITARWRKLRELVRLAPTPGMLRELLDLANRYDRRGDYFDQRERKKEKSLRLAACGTAGALVAVSALRIRRRTADVRWRLVLPQPLINHPKRYEAASVADRLPADSKIGRAHV